MEKLKTIGSRKYEILKSLDLNNITEENLDRFETYFKGLTISNALKQIQEYENRFCFSKESTKSIVEYFKKINEPEVGPEKKEMTKEWLWDRFVKNYKANEDVSYSRKDFSIENVKPLIYYFIGDLENFKACKNVSSLSEPSLSKGLLIIGGYGNGKTSVMRALERSLLDTNVLFKTKTANDIVTMFEACTNEFDKSEFWKYVSGGVLNFDDILTEREASNYGKVNLFKDVIEKRYDKKKRTYITCNFNDAFPEDLNEGLKQFGTKYGSRVYDRLFSMCNIITFSGKSFR